jgi:GT2 family glycosyltransferase
MKDITASLIIFNEEIGVVQRAINSFLNTKLDVEILLIDNSDISWSDKQWQDKRITYIFNGKNLGFAAGHNIGIRESQTRGSKYHLVLNPDIYFKEGVLEELFHYMEDHQDVGFILPKVLYPNGSVQHLYKLLPTPFDLLLRRFLPPGFRGIFRKRLEQYELKAMNLEIIQEIPYLSGCFMFLRSRAIEEVGLFDERFFLYLEDVDYSRRFYVKFKNIYYPHVSVFHEHRRVSYKKGKFLWIHMISAIRFFNKWGWIFDKQRHKINKEALESKVVFLT